MDTQARCEITELLKDQCAHCLGIKSPEEEAAEEQVFFDWGNRDNG